ncbi:GNAT family N-acetyltransferase [Polymorphobacter sp. PAMC 29334]|uniref:GNAT family N-acetyltransferase n=1 Tax=Polymorphobacter sp. PAMC 29334 TaxID=2862331 RepID=UPI001C78DB1F|nr:GNAT family N-acetyltransferase [Polymorphobacter sp. PAMC 29334]QYE35160.1 GNAT family N-acetyltransferase [Polymorphobacter sp. PAMC 29334]
MQRAAIPVRPATSADSRLVAATLARAFIDDPALAYLFPEVLTRPAKLLKFFSTVVRIEARPADTLIAGDGAAMTIWRPPGAWRTSPLAMLGVLVPLVTTFGAALPRALRLQALIENHHPATPHWYLAFAGCDPTLHGRGFGGAAIRSKLRDCDHVGIPTALETATPANLAIYAALGFAVTGEFDAAPGLRFWSMWREPVPTR